MFPECSTKQASAEQLDDQSDQIDELQAEIKARAPQKSRKLSFICIVALITPSCLFTKVLRRLSTCSTAAGSLSPASGEA